MPGPRTAQQRAGGHAHPLGYRWVRDGRLGPRAYSCAAMADSGSRDGDDSNRDPPAFTSVTPEAREGYTSAPGTLSQDVERKAAAIAREARRTLDPHVASVITRIHEGPPGNVIGDMTTACRANLVALGSRGLGMVAGFLCW